MFDDPWLEPLGDHFRNRVYVHHEGWAIGSILELMPGTGRHNCNLTTLQDLGLAIDNKFDIAIKNDKCFFIRVTVLPGALSRRELDHEE